jgi:uncharacterized protein YwqG
MYIATLLFEDISGIVKFWRIKAENNKYIIENFDLSGEFTQERIDFQANEYLINKECELQTDKKIKDGYKYFNNYLFKNNSNWKEIIDKYKEEQEYINILKKYGLQRKVWIPIVENKSSEITKSKFSGIPYVQKDEEFPKCKICKISLELFVQLNLQELPKELGITNKGLMQFFLCPNCLEMSPGSNGNIRHPLIMNGVSSKTRIIENFNIEPNKDINHNSLFPEKTIVNWKNIGYEYPDYLEDYQEKHPELIFEMGKVPNEWTYENFGGDKIGGYPSFCQFPMYPECKECGNPMKHIIQIASDYNIPYNFGDGGIAHIYFCEKQIENIGFHWDCC